MSKREPFARLAWNGRRERPAVAADLQHLADVFPLGSSSEKGSDSRLILGDNLGVMASLLPTSEGAFDLIYADPPFLSGKAYKARIGRGEDSRQPSEWRTTWGYQDTWRDGTEYLDMLNARLQLMYRLLAPTGTLYLHLDWHASAYARVLLDEIFGPNRLLNEIIWVYHGPSPIRSAFKRKHDTILVYTKSNDYTFNADAVRVPYNPSTERTFASSPKAGFGKIPDLQRGKVPEDWWYFPVVARLHAERTGYPTQKPEGLLERILLASSNPEDRVADFFCGSGTTALVADRLNRRWVACDRAPLAVHTTERRLLLAPAKRPFSIWRERGLEPVKTLNPEVRLHCRGRQAKVILLGASSPGSEGAIGMDPLTLWEVDWEYDGERFRSRSQAVRGWRDEAFVTTLAHAYGKPGPRRLAIRALGDEGQEGMTVLEVTVP